MVKITPIVPSTLALQTFSAEDFLIIPNTIVQSSFNPVEDAIEYFVYDYNNNLLDSNYQLTSFTPARLDGSGNILEMNIYPEKDVLAAGYDNGIVKTVYNFIKYHLGSNQGNGFYISEISPSRTEIRLSTNNIAQFDISNFNPDDYLSTTELENYKTEISQFFNDFKAQLTENNAYFDEFYLNLGDNLYLLGVNIVLEIDLNNKSMDLLVKLYEPLPTNIGLKSELYIVSKTNESVGYQFEFSSEVTITDTTIKLAPANYNIDIKDQVGPTTVYKTYSDITSTSLSGSLAELMSNISQSSPTLTVDYTDYNDFVFFSSANERLINFRNKVISISSSQAQLDLLYSSISGPSATSSVVSSSKILLEKDIQTTITSFDGYEKYLYYDSSSKSWPKSNSTLPYILVDPYDAVAINWFATQSITASNYDNENQNNLEFAIPEFIRYNNSNENYLLYTNMIGQFFDEIWLYTKEITSKLDANSSLYQGVSKDLVGTVLESLGTKIYDSSYTLENIYSSLIGLSADGSVLPSTGSEYITNYVTSSMDEAEIPTIDDFVKLSYKKIYHSLPYLLKKKGTNEGLRALINIFGVPDTILRISEFGGKDKDNTNDWDRWEHQFNYKYDKPFQSNYIETGWDLNSSWGAQKPLTVQLRFQTPGLSSSIDNPTQVLWNLDNTGDTALLLEYTGSGYTSGSYSGSIVNEENLYTLLKFIPDYSSAPTVSASVYLPFSDGGWWSVMVTKQDNDYTLYAANNIYSGSDGSTIGFIESSSITAGSDTAWNAGSLSFFGSNNPLVMGSTTYTNFSGSLQEIRYYNTALSASVFEDYTMNPHSIEGNGVNSAPDQLAFRASLGNDLYTGSISVHPKVTGSWTPINSFPSDSNFVINDGQFTSQRDYIFYDQIPAGVKNIVSNKIKQFNTDLPYTGSLSNTPTNQVLSSQIEVQQKLKVSQSYVDDINYLEVAFSPQNEINEDINSSIGYFNIGEYIGDPRLLSSSAETYPALDALRNQYFEKYTHNYNIWDYIRLIRYYDNALFKMVKDFVPARTSLATGIVIKQHILERNKYPVPQVNTYATTSVEYLNSPFVFQDQIITGSSIVINSVTGSNGGVMPNLNGNVSASSPGFEFSPITQSWSGINDTITGPVAYTSSTQHEFFDGELSGSEFIATNGEMNPECDPVKSVSTVETLYTQSWFSGNSESGWNYQTYYATGTGDIQFWFKNTRGNIATIFGPGSWDFQIVQVAIADETANLLDLSDKIPAATNITIPGTFDVNSFTLSGWFAGIGGSLNKTLTGGPSINLSIKSVQQRTSVLGERFYLLTTEPSELKFNVTNPGLFGSTGSVVVDSGSLWDETLVVLQPFVDINFFNSDCNPIINNSLNDRKDPFFFDVDYSSNAIVAVNTDSILSGSATPATVQYSNYTLARNINPRYLGSKNTGLYINKYTPSGSVYTDGNVTGSIWGGDQSFGKTAVIEQYGDYGIVYDGSTVGDLLNFGPNSIALNAVVMIDKNGNLIQPKSNAPYYWNGVSAFGGGNNLQVTVYSSESVSNQTLAQLQQPQKSLSAFTYLNTNLTTASGSINGSIYNGVHWQASGSIKVTDTKNNVEYLYIPGSGNSYFTKGTSSPTVLTSSIDLSVLFDSNASGSFYWEQPYSPGGTPTKVRDGYDNPTRNINPRIGQKLYFANMQNEFTITDIEISGSSPEGTGQIPVGVAYNWLIHLDKSMAYLSTQDLNKFIFMNYETDTSKIYIESELSGSAVGKGLILNDNVSEEFRGSLDSTVDYLRRNNIL